MHSLRLRGIVAALTIGCFVVGCGGDDSSSSGDTSSSSSTSSAATTTAAAKNTAPATFAVIGINIPGSDILGPYVKGAEAAAKQLNATGGFGGRKVELKVCNSMLSPSVTTTCAHKTLAAKPVTEFGCEVQWGSTGLQIYSKSGVPSFNCQNTQQDYTDPMSFGIAPSGIAEYRGMAKFLCTQSDVKMIVLFNPDIPQQHEIAADTVAPTLKTCGKSAGYVYYPITATDLTPYVQKTLDLKPDFIMTTGSGAVQYLRAFKTAGFPSEKIWTSSNNIAYSTVLKPAGDSANGLYSTLEFNNWDDQSADMAAYTKAVTANGDDPRDPGVEWGYSAIMFFHEAAKRIGFDTFDAASLTKFMQSPSSNGTPIPLSRPMKEGPKDYPAVRQTDVQVVQWKDGHLNTVTSFGNDGWIYGF